MTIRVDKTESKVRQEILRSLMDKYDLTAPDVAQILRIKPQTVRCYMCGIRVIPRRHLKRLRERMVAIRRRDLTSDVPYPAA